MVACGITFVLAVEYISDWRIAVYALAGMNLFGSITPLLLPETPYYLIDHAKDAEAE